MNSINPNEITNKNLNVLTLKQKCDISITEVLPPDLAGPSSLVFASTKSHFLSSRNNKVSAIILTERLYHEVAAEIPKNISVWTTKNIQHAMSSVLTIFDQKKEYLVPGIHPTAAVHVTAKVANSASIGAYAVIAANATIGAHSVIHPHVYIGPNCEVGQRCNIAAHASIGSDGFGFYTDEKHTHHKIPQIGKVVIEDDCEIGTHCAIDRATLTETRIKRGSKFDNFCHIAHNVQIGENALVAAGFIVAGSTIIGKNLKTSGSVHILGHLKIADNVTFSARAGVLQNVEESGTYGGFPLEPHRESVKTYVSIPQVKKLRVQVRKILKYLNIEE